MAKKQQEQVEWKNRIVNYGVKPASQFTAHPMNFRGHPKAQRESFTASARSLGWLAPVLESSQSGYVIDGHLRIEEALRLGDETPVPFISLDLSPDEEPLALASFDAITAMAFADKEKLDALIHDVQTDEPALQAMLSELAEKSGLDYFGDEKQSDNKENKDTAVRCPECGCVFTPA